MRTRSMTMSLLAWSSLAVILVAPVAGETTRGSAQPAAGTVALTFDDLPAHGPLPPGVTRVDVATSIIGALRAHKTPPVYGFVNARLVDEQPADAEVLRMWRAAGFPLGNHTFSHMDLNANPIEAFEQDVRAGEPLVSSLMGEEDWRWFRFPFLRAGDTPEKHRAVLAFLAGRGYKIAEVTINFDDYAYNEPYARCRKVNDGGAIAALERSFLTRAADRLDRAQAASRAIFGRDIKHIMLLHVGAFQTVMLPRLLDLLKARGWRLTTLADAAADPAYSKEAAGRTAWTGTFLDQHGGSDGGAASRRADETFQKLATLCAQPPAR